MSSKKHAPDPTQKTAKLVLGKETYQLVLTLAALGEAEERMLAYDSTVDLFCSLPPLRIKSTRVMLAACLMTHHPEIAWADAENLVTRDNAFQVMKSIIEAWNLSMPSPDKEGGDPTQPVA